MRVLLSMLLRLLAGRPGPRNRPPSQRYGRLSSAQKSDLALDRDRRRHKSNPEIGRAYERYIGHLYEASGWSVRYCGALDGFNDRGRDLVAQKDGVTHIVQCKCWKRDALIDEDVVFRLLGSMTQYAVAEGLLERGADILQTLDRERIVGVIVTTARLSPAARRACDALGIRAREGRTLADYPRVKCNVSADGARIYHLPRDAYYDRIRIEPEKGELYAWTAQEAERAGFRRARAQRSAEVVPLHPSPSLGR